MKISDVPFGVETWDCVPATEHPGTVGMAYWRTLTAGNLRVRMVEYTVGYVADHSCRKGHVVLVLEGELHTRLEDGRQFVLRAGQSYHVADDAEAHQSAAPEGAKLFIVD